MSSITRRMMVFQYSIEDQSNIKLSYLKELPSKSGEMSLVLDPAMAFDASKKSIEDIVEYLDIIQERKREAYKVTFVEVEVTTLITPVDVNSDEFIAERRRKALSKLSVKDIEALGVERLSVFNKVKFHGAQDV